MKQKFEVGHMLIKDLLDEYKTKKIIIPHIQRNLVWKEEQKQKLQASIAKGYPFGVITFVSFENDKNKKYILDGLQRTTTIMEIYTNIFKHEAQEDLEEKIISICKKDDLDNDLDSKQLKILAEELCDFLKKLNLNHVGNYDQNEIVEYIIEKINEKNNFTHTLKTAYIKSLLHSLYGGIKNKLDFGHYKIPWIKFIGDNEQASELFVLINTIGTKLSKVDILKSKWRNTKMEFNEPEISKMIKNNFQNICEQFSVEYEELNHLSPYDVIYYIFHEVFISSDGFLEKKFMKNKYVSNLDSLIYLIKYYTYENLQDRYETDDKIGKKAQLSIKNFETVNQIIADLKKACRIFNQIFNSLLNFYGNSISKGKTQKIWEPGVAQTVAIIGNIYSEILKDKKLNEELFVKINRKKILRQYLYDKLKKTFSSSSSKRAFESIESGKYLKDSRTPFKSLLNEIFENQMESDGAIFDSQTTKIIMSYIYKDIISLGDNYDEPLEEDHIIPKSKIQGFKGRSSFANYSLIKKDNNRSKSDELNKELINSDKIFVHIRNNQTKNKNEKLEELAKKLEIIFNSLCDQLNENNFNEFLKIRKDIIIELAVADEN